VISTGRRNTLVKSLCWRLEVQRFPGPLIELARHLIQLSLEVRGEIKALGEWRWSFIPPTGAGRTGRVRGEYQFGLIVVQRAIDVWTMMNPPHEASAA